MPKRIFSGVQPTGNVHLGNYLGALRNWVALQREYESFFCIVNLHAITVRQDPKLLAAQTRELARVYLALGIDPELSTIFIQSEVPEPFIPKVGARIMSLSDPSNKMSKSDDDANGCVRLLDDADSIQRKFKRAVTDSGTAITFDATRPAITNLLTIFQLLTGQAPEQVEAHFADKGYAQLKQELADATIAFLEPLQRRVQAIDDRELTLIMEQGTA